MDRNRKPRNYLYGAIVTVYFATAAQPAFAGNTGLVSGAVIDSDKRPAVGATVTLIAPTGRYRTVTDRHGRFTIVGVYVDTYTIRISKAGGNDIVLVGVDSIGDEIQDIGKVELPRSMQPDVAQIAR